eukprot:SAG22_NODE_10192_length_548_cov_0.988864_1_plen_80_part_00
MQLFNYTDIMFMDDLSRKAFIVKDATECTAACMQRPNCAGFSLKEDSCWLKQAGQVRSIACRSSLLSHSCRLSLPFCLP